MKPVQPLLLLLSAIFFFLYLRYFRSSFSDRFVALLIWICTLLTIMFPEITQVLAHAVGVGRGADMFIYLFAVGTAFVGLMFYSKISSLERLQTMLIRQIAIDGAIQVAGRDSEVAPKH